MNYGSIIFDEGKYNGEIYVDSETGQHKATGFGVYRSTVHGGFYYIGKWKKNHMTLGYISYEDGEKYLGDFYKGEYHGRGCHISVTGDYYIGDFVNGAKEGFGIQFCSDETIIIGNWYSGLPHGEVYCSVPGEGLNQVLFDHGDPVEKLWSPTCHEYNNGVVYYGNLAYSGDYLGFGERIPTNGARMIGNWLRGKVDGTNALGICCGMGGKVLEVGSFYENGRADGYIQKIYANGDMIFGDYNYGKHHGKVIHVHNNGQSLYIGNKEYGVKKNSGTLINLDGSIQSGTWNNDYFIYGEEGRAGLETWRQPFYGLLNGKKPKPASTPTYTSSTTSTSTSSSSQSDSYTPSAPKASASSASSYSTSSATTATVSSPSAKKESSNEPVYYENGSYHVAEWAKARLEDFNYKVEYGNLLITGLYVPQKHVVIPDFVHTIDSGAFKTQKCAAVESIVIPKSVLYLMGSCFVGCVNLKKVDLQASITYIPVKAFANTALEYIVLPDTVKTVRKDAFLNCQRLKRIYVPKGCKVQDGAIPDGCEILDKSEFREGEVDTKPTAPTPAKPAEKTSGTTSGTTSPTSGNTTGNTTGSPASSTAKKPTFGKGAKTASPTSETTENTVKIGRKNVTVPVGFVHKKVSGVHLFIGEGKEEGTVIVPEGVTGLPQNLYENACLARMRKLILPSTLTDAAGSFKNFKHLEEVDFSECKLTGISFSMFEGSGIRRFSLPLCVSRVDGWAFMNCKQLEYAFMPGVQAIATSAFEGCDKLIGVDVKEGCRINPTAFRGTSNVSIDYL